MSSVPMNLQKILVEGVAYLVTACDKRVVGWVGLGCHSGNV